MLESLERADGRHVTLVHVEDDEIEIIGLRRALGSLGLDNPVRNAHDGIEALELLRGGEGGTPLPAPYVILLDLNMPRMDGISFLRELRGDPKLRGAVVFVLSTSNAEPDRRLAYAYNVAGYIAKPGAGSSFAPALGLLDTYLKVVELPAMSA